MGIPFSESGLDKVGKLASAPADIDPVAEKLNRLVYAGGESVRREIFSRFENTLHNPVQAVISGGQAYVAGTLLGALGHLPGKFKCLGALTGTTLAAFSLKDELNPERLTKIGGIGQSIWDSKENTDGKICAMQKSLAPLVLDGGALLLGLMTGKQSRKRKYQENESESESIFQSRMDGFVTKITSRSDGHPAYHPTRRPSYFPWSANAQERKLFEKLYDAEKHFGTQSLAVADQRRQLSIYYSRNGQLKECQYQMERANAIIDNIWQELEMGNLKCSVELPTVEHLQNIEKAESHFRLGDKYLRKARYGVDEHDKQTVAQFCDKATLHYSTGLALHPGSRELSVRRELPIHVLRQSLEMSYAAHRDIGNLASAYAALKKRMITTSDGKIAYDNYSICLASLCHKMKFFDEAEQLYRGYLKNNPIAYDDGCNKFYKYTNEHKEAIKGITCCLIQRKQFDKARQLGTHLKALGHLNRNWRVSDFGPQYRSTFEDVYHILNLTRKFPQSTKTIELPQLNA